MNPSDSALRAVAWGSDPYFHVDPEGPVVPIDPRRFDKIMALGRKPIVQRLLLAFHYLTCKESRLRFSVTEHDLAGYVWASQRPPNWRSFLAHTVKCAVDITQTWLQKPDKHKMLAVSHDTDSRSFLVQVYPRFLMSLQTLIQDEQLKLLKCNPDPDAKISRRQLTFLRDNGWQSDADGKIYTDSWLRMAVRSERQNAAKVQTLAAIGRNKKQTGGFRTIYIPAVLGDRQVCREMGTLVSVLVDHCTRQKPVTRAMVPPSSASPRISCPLLDSTRTYAAFAGNFGGRGYRLAKWAKMLNTNERGFLKQITNAKERLGLVIVGVDSGNKLYDLDALLAGNAATWEVINVRIYTEADFRRRWATIFGWQAPTAAGIAAPATSDTVMVSDRQIFRQRVLEAGLRKIAGKTEVKPSHLSKFLKHGKGLAADGVARARQCVFEAQPLGGPEISKLFAGLTEQSPMVEWALAYRRLGWSIVPLRPNSRATYLKKWKMFQTCLPTEEQVRQWWTIWPDAAIGLVLGPISGVFALDCDSPEAKDMFLRRLGASIPKNWPMVLSGSRKPYKFHVYFRHPEGIRTGATCEPWKDEAKGLEFRGTNGLTILPPSMHRKSGKRYVWAKGRKIWELPLADVPLIVSQALEAHYSTGSFAKTKKAVAATGGGGFSSDFSTWGGQRIPHDVIEFLRGEHAHKSGWNHNIFRCARWCRDHEVPQDVAEHYLLQGAGPDRDPEAKKALATIRSAYGWLDKSVA